MNIKNLNMQLQKSISESTSPMDLMSLSKTIQLLRIGQIRTAANISSLPAANTHAGWVYFVESEERHFYSNNSTWIRFAEDRPVTSAFAWGYNNVGQLGDITVLNKSSPVSISTEIVWHTVSAGTFHSAGIDHCCNILSWGINNSGQIGDGTVVNKSSPTSVIGAANWRQVSAGSNLTVAVNIVGETWAWGDNTNGGLGDGTVVNKSSPVSVVGGVTNWNQVSATYYTLGVTSTGDAWAWGVNTNGQLGDNTTVNKSSPVSVVGGFTDWCQVSAANHSLGLRTNGTAWAWGSNASGRLGDDTTVSRSSPVSVVGGFADWCQASAGHEHSLGVRQNGTAWAWGSGANGRLGDNTAVSKSSPVSVVGGFTDWCQATGGSAHSLAVRQNGTVWAWGLNDNGQLGDGTVSPRSSPVSVVGGFTDWCQVSAGYNHSLAIASAEFKG
jgi:alpha-tubulin suppressor-like RCC1 family protein